jgi:hypothetical protein
MHLSLESLTVISTHVYKYLWWRSITTHPLGLSWRMTPYPQHSEPTFIFVRVKGQGYSWLLSHLSIHFALHILLSAYYYIFILDWFNPQHLVFTFVSVDTGWMHLAHILFVICLEINGYTWCHPKHHVCLCSKKWAHCMDRVVVRPYNKNFIMS